MKEAMDVYLFSDLTDSAKVEKSLILTNRALELDDHNLAALSHKQTLLFIKKDIEGLLKTTDYLIKLMPKKPFYLGQKALYLELRGDSVKASAYYDKSVRMYQEYIKTDSLNFNLMMEYIGVLEASGDTTLANKTLDRMEKMNFDESQKEIIQFSKHQSSSKNNLKRYLKGEIEYTQIIRAKTYPEQTP
jgi:tetratricopeptide (TPR) repeat protein